MRVKELFETTNWQAQQIYLLKDKRAKDYLSNLSITIDQIKRDCQPYIAELKKFKQPATMYRGTSRDLFGKDRHYGFELRKTPKSRGTKDVNPAITAMFDLATQQLFKTKFRTNNIFFGVGDINEAGQYGRVLQVFPVGEFKFLWSPHVTDFYDSDVNDKIYDEIRMAGNHGEKLSVDTVADILQDFAEYTDKNLEKALASGHEIMVQAKKYYAIDDDIFSDFVRRLSNEPFGTPEASMYKDIGLNSDSELLYYAITKEPKK